ncbi:uncharacterized protein M421DRAFT_216962 [Didymella exigua CBS 183.55]|uniref:Uncharacterized protein n=1 Tax=Didymella exigua CBS 183.55 TaxID=1150837 RepID=A0A6A5RGR6_9PLEO|nr:uncharacterized protein M421DRAFT_216962 [Didymella exigua CBS 183.55]KAF1926460.1 hypothetical protein M421DRAFT_216962 [Didymella exigua CBS 183.55]
MTVWGSPSSSTRPVVGIHPFQNFGPGAAKSTIMVTMVGWFYTCNVCVMFYRRDSRALLVVIVSNLSYP